MKVSSEQLIKGLVDYVDAEIIRSLPTTAKWLVGTYVGLVTAKSDEFIRNLSNNILVKSMDLCDDNGLWDVGCVMDALKQSASRYGKMSLQGLGIGTITFSAEDVDVLRRYIER